MRNPILNPRNVLLLCFLVSFFSLVNAQNIEFIGSCATPGQAQGIYIDGDYAFVADGTSGLQIIDIADKANPLLIGNYATSEPAHGVFADGNLAYIGADHAGLVIADISNPNNPSFIGDYDTPCNAYNVITQDGIAYVADIRSGLIILDISNPDDPILISAFAEASVYDIYLRDNYAYLAVGGFGIFIVNIADPVVPQFIGGLFLPPYHTATSIALKDDYAFLACGDEGLWIVDIADPANPEVITQTPTQDLAVDVCIHNNLAYVADANSGLIIFDIGEPANPVPVGLYQTSGQALAVTADDEYIYLADNDTGLLILRFVGAVESVILTGNQLAIDDDDPPIVYDPNVTADVGVTEIISPPLELYSSRNRAIILEIQNYGTEQQTFDIVFSLFNFETDSLLHTDTLFGFSLISNSIDTVTYVDSVYMDASIATRSFASTLLHNDENSENDDIIGFHGSFEMVFIWYGNPDGSPITTCINSFVPIDIYVFGPIDDVVADFNLVLGADTTYIDSFYGQERGIVYYPLTEWSYINFTDQCYSPPNPDGWFSQSVWGFARTENPYAPWLVTTEPTKIITTEIRTVNNPEFIGDTVSCIGFGMDCLQGRSNAGDTVCGAGLSVFEHFSPIYFSDNCNAYLPGDANMVRGAWPPVVIGNDVTFMVNYFRGAVTNPPCNLGGFFASADINGDCRVIGSDVTRLVEYFRGLASVEFCPDYWPIWQTPDDLPEQAPEGWPNCE